MGHSSGRRRISQLTVSKQRSNERTGPRNVVQEPRRVEALTVAWMLVTFAAFAAESLFLGLKTLERFQELSLRVSLVGNVLLVISLVAGIITLVLTPLAVRLRRSRPPAIIVISAYAIGIIPILAVVIVSSV